MENELFMSMLPTRHPVDILPEMNSSASSSDQSPPNYFFSPISPSPPVNPPTNDGSLIRELIGKFDNSPKLGNFNLALNPRNATFSADPLSGFNGRTSRFGPNHGEFLDGIAELTSLGKRVSWVSSSPSLKASQGNKALQSEELPNCQEGSSVSNPEKVPGREMGGNLKKRKSAILRGKVTEVEDESNPKRAKQSEGNGSEKKEENRGGDNAAAAEEKQTQNDAANPPEPLKDYIHVRARRGQATDSHSLAERVRREKISERMKMLQNLVPGCNKVNGKALMLDEIINYVQSLQCQVEFLSMKLATVDSSNSMAFNAEAAIMKDHVLFRSEDTAHPMFPQDSSASSAFYSQKKPALKSSSSVDPHHLLPLTLNGLNQHLLSYENFCEDDLHRIVNMGFGQNAFDPQSFHGDR